MKQAAELIDKLRTVFNGVNNADVFVATVTANNSDGTVNVKDLGEYEYNCRTQALENVQDGIKPTPTIGSAVLVQKMGTDADSQYIVIMYSSLDGLKLKISGFEYYLDANGHLIASPGGDTLLQVVTLLIDAVMKIKVYQGVNPDFIKLAQAKTKVNAILQ